MALSLLWRRVIWLVKFFAPIVIALPFMCDAVIYHDEANAGDLDKDKLIARCMGLTIWMALWWVLEPVNLVITAFITVFMIPFLGICDAKATASAFFSDASMVFMGGFLFSVAMTRWNLHSRIALKTVLVFGLRPKLLLLGISLVTWFLSMWISNTATALTMIPNCLAVVSKLEEVSGRPDSIKPFSRALFLSIAFSASIGGMGTLIGTPVNLQLTNTISKSFPDSGGISFASWFALAFPLSLVLVMIMYAFFVFVYLRKPLPIENVSMQTFRREYARLGAMNPAEWTVLLSFIFIALLWLFRDDLGGLPGWANLFPEPSYVKDGTAAMFVALLLFFIHVPHPKKIQHLLPEFPRNFGPDDLLSDTVSEEQETEAMPQELVPGTSQPRSESNVSVVEVANRVRAISRARSRAASHLSVTASEVADEVTRISKAGAPVSPDEEAQAATGPSPAADVLDAESAQEQVDLAVVDVAPPSLEAMRARAATMTLKERIVAVFSIEWTPILDWKTAQAEIPWSIVFLMGGGFALGAAFEDSGLSNFVGSKLSSLSSLPIFAINILVGLIITLLSNITSNTATAIMVLPIIADMAKNMHTYHPWLLLIPATLSASMCFVLPIASPPNLIAMASERLTTRDFVINGLFINITGLLISQAFAIALIPPIFGFSMDDPYPSWG